MRARSHRLTPGLLAIPLTLPLERLIYPYWVWVLILLEDVMSDAKKQGSGGCGCGSKKETTPAASSASGCCGGAPDDAPVHASGNAD